jgi:molybdate transport system substrate-binding protein
VRPAASLADVKSTLAAVESGEVDAGLVYVTDVRAAGDKVKGIAVPADVNASTTYPIAVLKDAEHPALARAWVDFVLSADGRKVLAAAGFARP